MMEGMDGMMDMMQRMHGNMMGGGVMKMLDADGNGTVTPEEMRTQLQAKLAEHGAVAESARQWPGHGRRSHDERQLRGSAPVLTGAAFPSVESARHPDANVRPHPDLPNPGNDQQPQKNRKGENRSGLYL
jgi:hypothetical protein